MDNEIMESVLTEMLEEQKAACQVAQGMVAGIKLLENKMDSFNEILQQQKANAPSADTMVLKEIITNGIWQIQQTVASQPKAVTRNFRFLLFPETNADQYYRIVFGRLMFWMTIFLCATYFFMLGKDGIESWRIVKEKEVEAAHALKAWRYLYQHEKKFREGMDSAWSRSW